MAMFAVIESSESVVWRRARWVMYPGHSKMRWLTESSTVGQLSQCLLGRFLSLCWCLLWEQFPILMRVRVDWMCLGRPLRTSAGVEMWEIILESVFSRLIKNVRGFPPSVVQPA